MKLARIAKQDDVVVLEIPTDNRLWARITTAGLVGVVLLGAYWLYWEIAGAFRAISWFDMPARRILFGLIYMGLLSFVVRRFLWFNMGREVVVIYPGELRAYRHLRYIAEGKVTESYQNIEVIFRETPRLFKDDAPGDIMDDMFTRHKEVILGFRLDGDQIIGMSLPVSIAQAEELVGLIGN